MARPPEFCIRLGLIGARASSPLKKCFESRLEAFSFRSAVANAVNLAGFQVKRRPTLDEKGRVRGRMIFSTGCYEHFLVVLGHTRSRTDAVRGER